MQTACLERDKAFVWKLLGGPGKLEINKQPHGWCQRVNSSERCTHLFSSSVSAGLLFAPFPLPLLQVLWEGCREGWARILKGTEYFSGAKLY